MVLRVDRIWAQYLAYLDDEHKRIDAEWKAADDRGEDVADVDLVPRRLRSQEVTRSELHRELDRKAVARVEPADDEDARTFKARQEVAAAATHWLVDASLEELDQAAGRYGYDLKGAWRHMYEYVGGLAALKESPLLAPGAAEAVDTMLWTFKRPYRFKDIVLRYLADFEPAED